MTVQKLYGTLKYLDNLDRNLRLQATLETIRDTLNNLVNAPAQPQLQSSLAEALSTFISTAAKLDQAITPSQAGLIAEMGGAGFFDSSIADNVKATIATNAMTPSVARDYIQDLAAKRAAFMTTVRSTFQGLQELKLMDDTVSPGTAELAFLIPREIFNNQLATFAKELTFINHLIRDFSEATTGHAEPATLQGLSSSVPTVELAASGVVILAIANTVNKFLDAWKKVEEIREIRGRLAKMGKGPEVLNHLTEEITTTVNEVVEESTTTTLQYYKGDEGRKNELSNALRQDTRRLFGQIERGLTVEFRAESKKDDKDEENKNALEALSTLAAILRFPKIEQEPMLLASGEVVEDSAGGVKVVKKTTLKTSKQETRKETKPETH